MFKKSVEAKAQQRLSGADRKKLKRTIKERFPAASDSDLDTLIPPKVEITVSKHPNRVLIYSLEGGLPIFFDVDSRGTTIFPTVYALWKVPHLLPSFILKGGEVSRYVIGGADLMFPGISIDSEGLPEFLAGQPWAVKVPGNPAPIAVGSTYMSSSEALKAGLRGKALKISHHYRDALWESAEGGYLRTLSTLKKNPVMSRNFSKIQSMAIYQDLNRNARHHHNSIDEDQIQTEEEAAYNLLHEKLNDLLATLPKDKGWRTTNVFLYKGFWLGPTALKSLLMIHEYFHPRSSDIFLAAFMRCGTTWLRALMFATANRHLYKFYDHPINHTGSHDTFPSLDSQILLEYPVSNFEHLPSPRLFATHFAHSLLPISMTSPLSSSKFVYVCRDPKDVLISKWHFMSKIRSKELTPISFNEAYELFCNGVSEFGPFWDHVLEYWKASQESPEKVLFLKYEDIQREPSVELKKLAAFMGMPFTAEEEKGGVVERIVKLCSYENMSNLEVNKEGGGAQKFAQVVVENRDYFRKGTVGDWKNYLTEEMRERIDSITETKFKGSGLTLGLGL